MATIRAVLIALGYGDGKSVIDRLISTGVSSDDKVLIAIPKPVEVGVARAVDDVKSFMRSRGLGEPTLIEIPQDPIEGISQVIDVLDKLRTSELLIDLSLGSSYLATYIILALLMVGHSASIFIKFRNDNEVIIPPLIFRITLDALSRPLYELLELIISKPGMTYEEITLRTGLKERVVRTLISELDRLGLVYRRGRAAGIYPSKWAQLIIKAMRTRLKR